MRQVYMGAIFLLFIFFISCTEQPTSDSHELDGSLAKGKGESSTYVLISGKWKSKQDNAVRKAGGEVTFSHEKSGILL